VLPKIHSDFYCERHLLFVIYCVIALVMLRFQCGTHMSAISRCP